MIVSWKNPTFRWEIYLQITVKMIFVRTLMPSWIYNLIKLSESYTWKIQVIGTVSKDDQENGLGYSAFCSNKRYKKDKNSLEVTIPFVWDVQRMESKNKKASCIINLWTLPVGKQADGQKNKYVPISEVRPEFFDLVTYRINYRFWYAPWKNKIVKWNKMTLLSVKKSRQSADHLF